MGNLNDAFQSLTGISLTTGAALAGIGAAVKFSIDQAAEAERVMAQTEAVIKSTGGAAGLSARQIAEMAAAFQQTTTFADDDIQSMQNVLLTFTALGKDVMPQATGIVLDMATALGTDLQSAAIQVGKALQDPVLGVSALRRVGVNFNEDQQKVIKNLVDTGQAAKAQAMILKELNAEFGGSAAAQVDTYSGQMAQLKNNVSDLAEEAGKVLVPALLAVTQAVNDSLTAQNDIDSALTNTGGSYSEYTARINEVLAAKGLWIDAQGRLVGHMGVVREETGVLTEAQFIAVQAAQAMADVTDRAADGNRELAVATVEAAAANSEAAPAIDFAANAVGRMNDRLFTMASLTRDAIAAQGIWADQTGNEVTAALRAAGVEGQAYKDALAAIDAVTGTSLASEDAKKTKMEELSAQYASGAINIQQFKAELAAMNALESPATIAAFDDLRNKSGELDDKLQQAAAQGIGTAKTKLGELGEEAGTKLPESVLKAEKQIGDFGDLLDEQSKSDGAINDYVIGLSKITAEAIRAGGAIRNIPALPGTTGGKPPKGTGGVGPDERALGGPVSAGVPYIVGERGPELFVPSQSGGIVPNHKLTGGGNSISIGNITIVSNDPAALFEAIEGEARARGYEFSAVR